MCLRMLLGVRLIYLDSNVSVVIRSLTVWQLAPRHAECETAKQPTILCQKHPIKDVHTLEGKSLSHLMPLLEFRRNFKEASRKNPFGRVIMDSSKPKKNKSVFSQTLRRIWVSKAKLGGA